MTRSSRRPVRNSCDSFRSPADQRRRKASRSSLLLSAPSSNGYDFHLFGVLTAIIGAQFFAPLDEATRNIFTLLAFAAGFAVRPFGALVFGRLGDLVGRKYTFLVTILIMGCSTFALTFIPGYKKLGHLCSDACLIALRLLQGLALGGEYGGAADLRGRARAARSPRLVHELDSNNRHGRSDAGLMVILARASSRWRRVHARG